jgi:small acid-soluble spore protein (thioredoxin-like protein)
MAKPDNRADNVEKLQEAVQNTIDNLEAAESYLNEFGDELNENDRQTLVEKNNRRRQSIEGMRNEIRDEAAHARGEG